MLETNQPEIETTGEGSGSSLNSMETPSGNCTFYIEIRENNIDYVYLRPPSLFNLEGFLSGMQGNVKTDFPFAYESFGIWVSEMSVIS
jgi:Ni,Fe-hydrogenase III large subunit